MAKYRVQKRLYKDGKRIGFVFKVLYENGSDNIQYLKNHDVLKLIVEKKDIDLIFKGGKFYCRDARKKVSDLEICYAEEKKRLQKNTNFKTYTDVALKKYIEEQGIQSFAERDFVLGIREYFKNSTNRVYAVAGLRGTGKTTGILQAISSLDNVLDVVYMIVDEMADVTCLDLKKYLMQFSDKKYIIIDEVTRVRDLITKSGFLADELVGEGKRVVLCGTDSLALCDVNTAGLYHRVIVRNVTPILYSEAKRTMNQSLMDYIQIGGLYKADRLEDVRGLIRYVDTAVVDNLMNTFVRNPTATSLLGLQGIMQKQNGKEKLRVAIFKMLYSIIYCILHDNVLNFDLIVNLFDIKGTDKEVGFINAVVESELNISMNLVLSNVEMHSVLNALEQIGLVVEIKNVITKEPKYYIINSSVATQIMGSIVSFIEHQGVTNKVKNANIAGALGFIFESMIIMHTVVGARKYNLPVYYYRDEQNREIDLIVYKRNKAILCYEVKMTNDVDTAIRKTRWLNDKAVQDRIIDSLVGDISVFGVNKEDIDVEKAIIYSGKNEVFEQFRNIDDLLQYGKPVVKTEEDKIKKLEKLRLIEEQNKGIQLLNAEGYMLNIADYMADFYYKEDSE